MLNEKNKWDFLFTIISFCLGITLTFVPIYFFREVINELPLLFKPITTIIFGLAGVGLYVIVGFKLREIQLNFVTTKRIQTFKYK